MSKFLLALQEFSENYLTSKFSSKVIKLLKDRNLLGERPVINIEKAFTNTLLYSVMLKTDINKAVKSFQQTSENYEALLKHLKNAKDHKWTQLFKDLKASIGESYRRVKTPNLFSAPQTFNENQSVKNELEEIFKTYLSIQSSFELVLEKFQDDGFLKKAHDMSAELVNLLQTFESLLIEDNTPDAIPRIELIAMCLNQSIQEFLNLIDEVELLIADLDWINATSEELRVQVPTLEFSTRHCVDLFYLHKMFFNRENIALRMSSRDSEEKLKM